MNANLTVSGGDVRIEIDIGTLIDACPAGERDDLLQRVACNDEVIRHVMDLVLLGLTENASCGSTSCDDLGDHPTPIEVARERLMNGAADAVALETIARLRRVMRWREERSRSDWTRICKLEHELSGVRRALRERGLEGVA